MGICLVFIFQLFQIPSRIYLNEGFSQNLSSLSVGTGLKFEEKIETSTKNCTRHVVCTKVLCTKYPTFWKSNGYDTNMHRVVY